MEDAVRLMPGLSCHASESDKSADSGGMDDEAEEKLRRSALHAHVGHPEARAEPKEILQKKLEGLRGDLKIVREDLEKDLANLEKFRQPEYIIGLKEHLEELDELEGEIDQVRENIEGFIEANQGFEEVEEPDEAEEHEKRKKDLEVHPETGGLGEVVEKSNELLNELKGLENNVDDLKRNLADIKEETRQLVFEKLGELW